MFKESRKRILSVILCLCFIIPMIFSNISLGNVYASDTVTIYFIRNWGNNLNGTAGSQSDVYTHTFQVGERLPGYSVFGSDAFNEVGDIGPGSNWVNVGNPIDAMTGQAFGRAYAWNTARDGSGTFYRGNQVITKDMDGIDLYQCWIDANDAANLGNNIGNPRLYRLDIKLNQGDYENTVNPNNSEYDSSLAYPNYSDGIGSDDSIPYNVDQAMSLKYRGTLNFDNAKKYLAVLWGRIDKVRSMHGTMTAKFDARLKFDKNIQVSFESGWLEPDEKRLAQYGVSEVVTTKVDDNTWRHTFTVSSDFLNGNKQTIQGVDYKLAVIPVTGAKDLSNKRVEGGLERDLEGLRLLRTKFGSLSFEDFMKDMQLSVADDFDRGINAIIDRDSYNEIANSSNPVVITKGAIELLIEGSFAGIDTTYKMRAIAYDEMAKLYPSGVVEIDYKEVGTNLPLAATQDGDVNEDEYKTVIMGRSKHNVNLPDPSADLNDVSQPYKVEVPVIPGYTFVGVQTEGKTEEDKQLTGLFKHSVTPKITLLYQKIGALDVKYVIRGTDIEIKDSKLLIESGRTLSTLEYSVSGDGVKTVVYDGNSMAIYDLPEMLKYRGAEYKLFGRRSSSASDERGILTEKDQTIIYEYELAEDQIPLATPDEPDKEVPDKEIPSDKATPSVPDKATPSEPMNNGGSRGGSGSFGGGFAAGRGTVQSTDTRGPGMQISNIEIMNPIAETSTEAESVVNVTVPSRIPKTADNRNLLLYYIFGFIAMISAGTAFVSKNKISK